MSHSDPHQQPGACAPTSPAEPTLRAPSGRAEDTRPSATPCRRRAYAPPRILHRQSLEAMAADCGFPGGKGDPTCSIGFS